MRMLLVPTEIMCRHHLLGEHHELHMIAGALKKGKSIAGYLSAGFIDTTQIVTRHEELVTEMIKRGYNHQSPIDTSFSYPSAGHIDVAANILELARRCDDCRKRIQKREEKRGK